MNSLFRSKRKELTRRFGSVVSLLALALSLAAFGLPAAGQTAGQNPSKSEGDRSAGNGSTSAKMGPSPVLADIHEDYRIGPGDVIQVDVEKAPELSRAFRVTSRGTFLMPYLGSVQAAGLTVEELSKQITDGLKGDYLRHPIVTVAVREYNSRAFFILGSVRSPGVYQVEGKPSLLTLITLAGGLADNHGSTAYIIRQGDRQKEEESATDAGKANKKLIATANPADAATEKSENPAQADENIEVKTVNIAGLLRGYLDNNKYLQPRDIVNIPAADVFFVAGEVNKPGSFPLRDGTTLRQAVSLAQGTTYKAATGNSVIYRDDPKGGREEIHVDLAAVLSGKKDDVRIMPNDVIVVPNSQMKSIGGALLRAFGLSSVARLPL